MLSQSESIASIASVATLAENQQKLLVEVEEEYG